MDFPAKENESLRRENWRRTKGFKDSEPTSVAFFCSMFGGIEKIHTFEEIIFSTSVALKKKALSLQYSA